jgi:hypothetical protein
VVSLPARRLQVGFLIDRGVSQRRACRLIGVARSTLKYVSILDTKDTPVIAAMKRLSGQYPRYGYRRIPERVNDFATPDVMNLLCGAAAFVGRRPPWVAG